MGNIDLIQSPVLTPFFVHVRIVRSMAFHYFFDIVSHYRFVSIRVVIFSGFTVMLPIRIVHCFVIDPYLWLFSFELNIFRHVIAEYSYWNIHRPQKPTRQVLHFILLILLCFTSNKMKNKKIPHCRNSSKVH